jgi:protein gp37
MHCYAERMAQRLQAMGQPNYVDGFKLAMHEHALELPLKWKKPRTIFVNSMSDLFLKGIPKEFIVKVFNVMARAHWHTFQVLTKRSERLLELSAELPWAPNIWMGVTVENKDYTFRIDHLLKTGACLKFLSIEPLLGPIPHLNLDGIDWVIVGGESGPGARPMEPKWVFDIAVGWNTKEKGREAAGWQNMGWNAGVITAGNGSNGWIRGGIDKFGIQETRPCASLRHLRRIWVIGSVSIMILDNRQNSEAQKGAIFHLCNAGTTVPKVIAQIAEGIDVNFGIK